MKKNIPELLPGQQTSSLSFCDKPFCAKNDWIVLLWNALQVFIKTFVYKFHLDNPMG